MTNDLQARLWQPVAPGAPEWLLLAYVLIGLGVVLALLILWWGARAGRRRRRAYDELVDNGEAHYEEEVPYARPITPPPPVAPSPPPLVEPPLAPPPPLPVPVVEEEAAFTTPEPEPRPQSEDVEPVEQATLADEPIAAAAPFEATPASIAADMPETMPAAPEPEREPDAAPEPEPVPEHEATLKREVAPAVPESVMAAADDLTRMKGVGPRLADRLNSVGISSFAQIAALTPEDAEALDARLGDFQGRIHRDRWIEQAGYLARGDVAGFEETFGKL